MGAVVLTLHEQEEAFGVLLEDMDGLFCHLHDGRIKFGVPVLLKAQISWFKQSWGGGGIRKQRKRVRIRDRPGQCWKNGGKLHG